MANAEHFYGTVLDNGTCRLKGQIANDAGDLLTIAGTSVASYTIYEIDPNDEDNRTAIEGHEDVALTVADVILDSPGSWDIDDTGYNFLHEIDISTNPAFTLAGREYLVVVSVTPTDEQPRLGAFRQRVI